MTDLVKALNQHVTTPNWNKDVATKLDKMVEGVSCLPRLSRFFLEFPSASF